MAVTLTYSTVDTLLSFDQIDTTLTFKTIDTVLTYDAQSREKMTNQILFPKEGDFTADTSMTFAFSIPVAGATSVSSPANLLYKGTEDVSSTYLTGSASASGTTITTKTCAITVADEYILKTTATVDGFTRTFLVKIIVNNPWDML